MPELPEVETVCRGLSASITGATIARVNLRRADLRIPFPKNFVKLLAGRTIISITRRAKYILFYLDDGSIMLAHLGMSGSFSVCHSAEWRGPDPAMQRDDNIHDHVIIHLGDKRMLIYNDPRRFGLMTLLKSSEITTHPLLAHLGPEPFSQPFNARYLKAQLQRRKGAIKPTLMDQTLVVGVGNIYASEALFLAGINPTASAKNVAGRASSIIPAIRKVLAAAIESGGSSLRDFIHVSGEAGYFQHQFNVYGRAGEPCFSCHQPIRSIQQAGRSTFYCPTCQR